MSKKGGLVGPCILMALWDTIISTIGVGVDSYTLGQFIGLSGLAGVFLLTSVAFGWLTGYLVAFGAAIRQHMKAHRDGHTPSGSPPPP